jgi:diaminopimelate decarboxylase
LDHFNYDADGQLQAEQLPLQQLADQYGTPLYVYSRATLNATGMPSTRRLATFPT